jgi:hypothetical protein
MPQAISEGSLPPLKSNAHRLLARMRPWMDLLAHEEIGSIERSAAARDLKLIDEELANAPRGR